MPLDIQTGGFAESVRRALGVRGRMPLRLDETVVPVVISDVLNVPPFRLGPLDLSGSIDQPNIAAEFAFGGLQLPATVPGAIVIDGWLVTASGGPQTLSLFLGSQASYAATATSAPAQHATNLETYPLAGLGIAPREMPFGQLTRGTDAVLGIGTRVADVRLLSDTSIYLPWRATLRPGWAMAWWVRTVNIALVVSVHATYYPDGPQT